jgi:hypothetical protein
LAVSGLPLADLTSAIRKPTHKSGSSTASPYRWALQIGSARLYAHSLPDAKTRKEPIRANTKSSRSNEECSSDTLLVGNRILAPRVWPNNRLVPDPTSRVAFRHKAFNALYSTIRDFRPKAAVAGSLPCSSGVSSRSSDCPVTTSMTSLAAWLKSRGRLGICSLGPLFELEGRGGCVVPFCHNQVANLANSAVVVPGWHTSDCDLVKRSAIRALVFAALSRFPSLDHPAEYARPAYPASPIPACLIQTDPLPNRGTGPFPSPLAPF